MHKMTSKEITPGMQEREGRRRSPTVSMPDTKSRTEKNTSRKVLEPVNMTRTPAVAVSTKDAALHLSPCLVCEDGNKGIPVVNDEDDNNDGGAKKETHKTLMYEGHVNGDGKSGGYWIRNYADGQIYKGELKNGKREGRGTMLYSEGSY